MPPNKYKTPSLFVQLMDIFLIELTNWRWSWRSLLLIGMVAPLLSIAGLGVFARSSGREALMYVETGNVVLALMFGNMDKVLTHIVYMRFQGVLDYFATLPIRKPLLILALIVAFLLISLPSLLATIFFGALILGLPLSLNPLIVLVIPLCAMPLAGIGALIGARARTMEEASTINLLLTVVLLSLGPVVIPPNRLPSVLIFLGRFSPATYAASALRQVLFGPVTGQLAIDLAVLAVLTVIILWLVERNMDWRER